MTFRPFPKLARLSRPVIVTEKIDGTNAQIFIPEVVEGVTSIKAGSRTRWLTPEDDNFGFCKWVGDNFEELLKLGPGHHYGEWWGRGIQRGYSQTTKRFSLFNVSRWAHKDSRPACCDVVPIVAELPELDIWKLRGVLKNLIDKGSAAAPGFMNPEGIVVFHTHGNMLFKMTLDDGPKEKKEKWQAKIAAQSATTPNSTVVG